MPLPFSAVCWHRAVLGGLSVRRGPAVVLLFLLLFATAYGAQRAVVEGWNRVVGFRPAHFEGPKPVAGPAALTSRAVLIVAEGLRPEDAPLLPSLDWLARQGATFRLSVPEPVYPWAAASTLLTGAPPELHGMVVPLPGRPLQADHVAGAAGRVNVSAGGTGSAAWGALLGNVPWQTAETPGDRLALARSLLAPTGPQLVMIQTDDLHTFGHFLGIADPSVDEYKEQLARVDSDLQQLLDRIDLNTTTVIVTGTVPTDRDAQHPAGGQVPLIMAGPGVKPGAKGHGSLIDVAPTLAALLGSPTPLQSQGRPLAGALEAEGRPADVVAQRYLAVRKIFADEALHALGVRGEAPEAPTSAAEADSYLEALEQQMEDARFTWWKETLLDRLPYLGGILLALLLYLIVAYRQPYGGPLLAGTLTYAAIFHLLLYTTGGRYSAQFKGLEALDQSLASGLGLRTALAMTLASVVTGLLLSRRGFKKRAYLTAASLHMALSTSVAIALPVVGAVLWMGWDFPVELPAPGLLVWYLVTALQVVVVGYMSPVWAVVTVAATRIAQSLWPVKEIGDPVVNADKVVRLRSLQRSARAKPSRG